MDEMDEIWAEIDTVYGLQKREVGDIDSRQMSKRYGIAIDTASRRMKKLVDSGEYEFVTVKDKTYQSGKCRVIRKVHNNN